MWDNTIEELSDALLCHLLLDDPDSWLGERFLFPLVDLDPPDFDEWVLLEKWTFHGMVTEPATRGRQPRMMFGPAMGCRWS